jgi:hypothetical protein
VLSRAPWSGLALGCALMRFLLDHLVPDGPVVVVGDDTVDGHKGKHVYGKAPHRDPVRSTRTHTAWRYGHRWVVLAVLVRRGGATALLGELASVEWNALRGYFEPHVNHTGYAHRLRLGQSNGSGLVGGVCKQVIGRRLKPTGARWKVRRVERMATLCALQASDQWDAYWAGKA